MPTNPFLELQEYLGPAKYWPDYIRYIFFKKPVNYVNRLKIATFGFINIVHPVFLCKVYKFCNRDFKISDEEKIIDLYVYWMKNWHVCDKYYGYSLIKRKQVTLPRLILRRMFPRYPHLY